MSPSLLLAACSLAAVLAPLSAAETPLVKGGAEAFAKSWSVGLVKTVADVPAQGGPVLTIAVEAKPEKQWEAQTSVSPLAADIAEGDTIRVTFSARTTLPADKPGRMTVALGLNGAPYTQTLTQVVEPGVEWKEFTVTAVAKAALPAAQARFGFVVGYQAQTIEIAKLAVVDLGKP